MFDPRLGAGTLFVADDHDGAAVQTRRSAQNGGIFAVKTVPAQRREIFEKYLGIIDEMRPRGMTGDLCFLPWCQLGVTVAQQLNGFFFQPRHFFFQKHRIFMVGKLAQLANATFNLGNRFLKIEITMHLQALCRCARCSRKFKLLNPYARGSFPSA